MTETRAVSIEDVRTLVAERQRYDDWLSALEAKRAETPARVFDRVHGDYSARRDGVLDRLRSHESALSSLGEDLAGRLANIESRLATLEDERSEAMLRTAVGEFDNDRWEAVRRDVETGIESHTAERASLLVEVEDVRSLLASTRHAPTESAAKTAQPEGAEEGPAESGGEPAPLVELRAGEVESAFTNGQLAAEQHADALSATDTFADERLFEEAAIEASAEAALGVGPAAGMEGVDDQAALDIEDALALFSPIDEMTELTEPAPTVRQTPITPMGGGANDAFDDLAFLHSVIDPGGASPAASVLDRAMPTTSPSAATSEQQKTLRCTECSTMNLPTEWYCERCGGELAAF